MSGDVQPRKRKDKKKKKETSEEIPVQSTGAQNLNDDVNIHVHKESTTGGEFCAKFIFFIVMAAIAVVIGLAIVEYRGQTDLDTISTESRFAPLFEGWVDKSQDHHDHEDDIPIEHSDEDVETVDEEKPDAGSEEDEATSQQEDDYDGNKDKEEEDDERQEENDEDEINETDASEEENQSEEADANLVDEDEEKDENEEEVDEDEDQNSIADDLTQAGGVKVLPDDEAESESDEDKAAVQRRSGAQSFYAYSNITNENDYVIRRELDDADKHLEDE